MFCCLYDIITCVIIVDVIVFILVISDNGLFVCLLAVSSRQLCKILINFQKVIGLGIRNNGLNVGCGLEPAMAVTVAIYQKWPNYVLDAERLTSPISR